VAYSAPLPAGTQILQRATITATGIAVILYAYVYENMFPGFENRPANEARAMPRERHAAWLTAMKTARVF
jgi:hypothetical protein